MPFHVMTKPVGAACNLDCTYCYYLEKAALYPEGGPKRMSEDVLEKFIEDYINSQAAPEVTFAWQGGEPTLYGLDTFKKIVELQRKHAGGRRIQNSLQTNGTLLNDDWGEFLAKEGFLIGISIDGPAKFHDAYRVDRRGGKTYASVMRGLGLLKKHGVDFNTMTVVNRLNSKSPEEVYKFLRLHGSGHMQFIPLVERLPPDGQGCHGLSLAGPPDPDDPDRPLVTEWSVRPRDYGRFLTKIFDLWLKQDVGKVFIQMFEGSMGQLLGRKDGLCVHSETCGRALALEHNGDVYACDHYVYPEHKIGNVREMSLTEMMDSPRQKAFGAAKRDTLPRQCRECPVRMMCHGGCPKHRFLHTSDGEPGLNYLCRGYKEFFHHAGPRLYRLAGTLGLR